MEANKSYDKFDWIKKGETVCDPFCGTGTTLLEAESMGIHAIGLDFDEKMCEISKENLKANGYKSKFSNQIFKNYQKSLENLMELLLICHMVEHQKHQIKPEEILKKFFSILT